MKKTLQRVVVVLTAGIALASWAAPIKQTAQRRPAQTKKLNKKQLRSVTGAKIPQLNGGGKPASKSSGGVNK